MMLLFSFHQDCQKNNWWANTQTCSINRLMIMYSLYFILYLRCNMTQDFTWHQIILNKKVSSPLRGSWIVGLSLRGRLPAGQDCCLLSPKLKARSALLSFPSDVHSRWTGRCNLMISLFLPCWEIVYYLKIGQKDLNHPCAQRFIPNLPQVLILALLLAVAHAEVQLYMEGECQNNHKFELKSF